MSKKTGIIRRGRGGGRHGAPRRRVAAAGLAAVLGAGVLFHANPFVSSAEASSAVPPCAQQADDPTAPPGEPPVDRPTTVVTLQQVYECILANAYAGPVVDSRDMLASAFAYFTSELQRRGVDRPAAALPKLTGNSARDWKAFAATYEAVRATLPDDAMLRQRLDAETIKGMIEYLRDNHAGWLKGQPGEGPRYTLGIMESPTGRPTADLRDATVPLYLKTVDAGSPAEQAGLKPGDILVAVNGVPLAVNGQVTAGAVEWLHPKSADTVKVTVERPSTGKTLTVEMAPAVDRPQPQPKAGVELVADGIAKVTLPSFSPGVARDVLDKLAGLRRTAQVRGIVFDVRGNGGGRGEEVITLISSFVHGKVTSSECDVRGRCTPNRTDDSVPLLNLPMTVVTDGMCASACDDFVGAVKDLGVGKVVGARTAGKVSGKPLAYRLEDGSTLLLPKKHHVSANGERINDIGVAVDVEAPVTAADLSAGRDPGMDKAVALLTT
ncbi:MAG: PDZ domain-containing protein [Streptomycetaceae bacterium]|nr:PDZ domain-containing protein [Streptomycetaceae bacterium]